MQKKDKQWEILKGMKKMWGSMWVLERDFNDIKNNEKKKGGMRMQESSFRDFRNFISDMELGGIKFKTEAYYWINNRQW